MSAGTTGVMCEIRRYCIVRSSSTGLKRLVAQNEFCVDVQRHNLLEVVIVKKMEHDGPSSDEGLDIGIVFIQVFR